MFGRVPHLDPERNAADCLHLPPGVITPVTMLPTPPKITTPMTDALTPILRDFLAEVSTLSLATVDDAGRPHAANVNFVAAEAFAPEARKPSPPLGERMGEGVDAANDEMARPSQPPEAEAAQPPFNLCWLSKPESAHSLHIAARPAVAATAYAPFNDPSEIRGVQLHGHAELAPNDDFDRLWTLFCEKFPYAARFDPQTMSDRFYRLRLTWARFIDNRVRFGHKVEADWPIA